MYPKILAVAGPEWQTALIQATQTNGAPAIIETQNAADAVIKLATRPTSYRALALDPNAGGPWLETLIDLTLGDTDHTVPLLMLGQGQGPAQLSGTPTLNRPFDAAGLARALENAASHSAQPEPETLPNPFNDINCLRIRYQPVVRLADLMPTSAEILVRLITKTGQTLGPGSIIEAMTTSDNAMALSGFILQRAIAERRDSGLSENLSVAFNLPLDTVLHPKVLPALQTICEAAGIPANALKLELTETQPVTNTAQLGQVIAEFTKAGYRLALDDITPTTPNLAALLNLPFRAFKLDRSVVAQAQHYEPKTAAAAKNFITQITSHATNTNRTVIAEGIENHATMTLMKSLGATHGQGYHFARPLPARAMKPWLTHWRTETGV